MKEGKLQSYLCKEGSGFSVLLTIARNSEHSHEIFIGEIRGMYIFIFNLLFLKYGLNFNKGNTM